MQLAATVGKLSGLSQNRVQELAQFRSSLVRDLEPQDAYNVIGAAINQVATSYGVNEEPAKETLDECIRLIGSKFGHLSPLEIRTAYRMWVAGELQVGKEAEMWGGRINARNLGAVISAYSQYRKKDMAKYLNAIQNATEDEARKAKEAQAKADFEQQFAEELAQAVESMENWKQVKPFWFPILWKRQMITMKTEQIEAIKVEAAELAKQEHAERERQLKEEGALFEQVAEPEGIEKAIRKRLAVWRYYILPKREELNQ